jgi:hypothetical protein
MVSRMIPKSMSSTPIGDGNRFSDKIMRKEKCEGRRVIKFKRTTF